MRETTKAMAKTALIAENNPQATSEELLDRGIAVEHTHAIWLSLQQIAMLEEILYRHATVCTMIADQHMREGRQALMISLDNKARNLEELAYKIALPLDQEYILKHGGKNGNK